MTRRDSQSHEIHLFINALAASAGGGLTYIRNILPCLAAREDVRVTIVVGGALRHEISSSARIATVSNDDLSGSIARLWYEQWHLPRLIRRSGAQVLLSTGNFALFRSPVPQILLSRNALYTSTDFERDLRERGDSGLWLEHQLKVPMARWSVRKAECTVAPSAAFARELRRWTGNDVMCIRHGFDHALFFSDQKRLPPEIRDRLDAATGSLRLVFVSHYNYYRNFETLIRAVAILKEKLRPRPVRLILTCKLKSEENPGNYRADTAADLVNQLRLNHEVVELGSVPYAMLHHLYRACHLYVTPAYAETFAHPLVEAMASGLPVIASDIAVHREICRDAALYFPRFSPAALAERVLQAAQSAGKTESMRTFGLSRSRDFSWEKHVAELLRLARRLAAHT
ncbi:MAG: glycosyltransferase family 1 protein [Candidatus Sulfotelmatobacter sp.]|jgi:glycosyltransferase involved in cell wall biosynthesis